LEQFSTTFPYIWYSQNSTTHKLMGTVSCELSMMSYLIRFLGFAVALQTVLIMLNRFYHLVPGFPHYWTEQRIQTFSGAFPSSWKGCR